jgi:hypothetical protein
VIVGTLGLWDQTSLRQIEVARYRPAQALLRPLINGWAKLRGLPTLPPAGSTWQTLMAALPATAVGHADVLVLLLAEQLNRAARGSKTHVCLGLCRGDPLHATISKLRSVNYPTELYLAAWSDGEPLVASLDARPPYLELGCL